METVKGIKEVMAFMPHRYPFLFIDRILEVHEGPKPPSRQGRKAVAIKNVTINEQFFSGHFPDRPVMPGVLLIEAMAQAGCVAFHRDSDPDIDVAIASIRDARIRRPVVPGDTLRLTAEIVKDRGQMIVIQCKAHVDGQLVAEAEILAAINFRPLNC
jgi:3-hydroxyacyl-[acyl-carrier-protein] dehydratase